MATPKNTSLVNQTLLLRNAGCISSPAQPSYFRNAGCISTPTRSRRVWFTRWWWNTSSAVEVEGSGSWDYPQCKQFSRVAPSRRICMEAPANVDTTRLLNRYGMIEKSYHASCFVRGSVAWPASVLCCAVLRRFAPHALECILISMATTFLHTAPLQSGTLESASFMPSR